MRLAIAALALLIGASAHAQTTSAPAVQQVQLLAPQLVNFSGSTANFESLVSGLTAGTPVTLTTLGADGTLQVVTFVPGLAMSAADAARTLEAARQSLIARGVATPNAQQLAAALMGGTLNTGTTSTMLPGILTGTATSTTVQVRTETIPASAAGLNTPSALSPANVEALRASLPPATTASLSATDFDQALRLAIGMLAQQGIVNPTTEQLRVALLGGTLLTGNGASATLQGVLQPRVRSTSESPFIGTSNSPLSSTSNSPLSSTSNSPLSGTSNTPPTLNPIVTPAPVTGAAMLRPPSAAPVLNRLGTRPGG